MAPILYFSTFSRPSRAALMTVKALNLDFNLKEIDLIKNEQLSPDYLKINPQHTVPTLVEEDGFILWESHAVMPYLVEKYGKNDSLYPKDLVRRAIVNQRLYYESGVLFPLFVSILSPILRLGEKDIPQSKLDLLIDVYDLIEKFLEEYDWIAGETMTIADFSVVTSFTNMDLFQPIEQNKHPKTVAWIKRIQKLPYYDVNQRGLDLVQKLVDEKPKDKS